MARLYAATGDRIARVDEVGEAWTAELFLPGSAAQCVAVDPADPDVVYAGLRQGGVRRSIDRGKACFDCELPEPAVFSLAVSGADGAVYAGTEPSRLFRATELELSATPVDLRPGAQLDVHSLAWHPDIPGRAYEAGGGGTAFSTDSGETWQRADEGRDRHYAWSVTVDPDDPDWWYVSASTGPFAAHGQGDPQARIYRRRYGEARQPLADGLLFAGLADGELWESRDRGASWARRRLEGDNLNAVLALAHART